MSRALVTSLVSAALVFACSSHHDVAGSHDTTDDPSKGDTQDGGHGPLSGDGDLSSGDGDGNSSMDGGFMQCAGARFDADVGKRASNIVWVIDTSRSMQEEGAEVQDNMNNFVTAIAAAGLEDYRVVVVSEPDYVSVPDPLGSDATHFQYVQEDVGSHEPLSDLLDRFADYADFLLPNVVTHFVAVTDDDSDMSADDFVSQMKQKLAGEFRLHAVASPPDSTPADPGDGDGDGSGGGGGRRNRGCQGPNGDAAANGVEYYNAAEETHGLTFSICTEDWSGLFTELAKAVGDSAPLPCKVALPKPMNGQTLDPNLVNVLVETPGADSTTFPRVDGADACGDKQAWHYDDAKSPHGIELCPAACTLAGKGGSLQVALGCQTVVL